MKPPFSYYGGKQRMCHNILPLFPEHRIYVEPFSGAGTLLFAQKPHGKTEVLNDINSLVYNFFKVLKEHRAELISRLECCPYSQELHKEAKRICKECTASDMELAEAFFINVTQSFACELNNSWGTGKFIEGKDVIGAYTKKISRLRACSLRLMKAYISNEDAVKCIKRWDDKEAFFYCDPPYIDTDCGHYSGYTHDQYQELISTLENIKGKALVSGYENDIIPKTWKRHKFPARSSVSNTKSKKYDLRIEVVFEKP